MRVLAFDPGGERMGYAGLAPSREEDGKILHLGSGIFGLARNSNESKLTYQEYRLALIDLWVEKASSLIESLQPDVIVNEIVPPVGGNAANQIQRQLALTAITVVQTVARQHGLPVEQLGANTVKAKIGGGKKATKVAVRNGVIKLMPTMSHLKGEMPDLSDAFAVGLTHLGCDNGRS